MYKYFFYKLRKYKSDKKGVAAIEFALIAPMLLFLTFGTLELSFYNYMRANIENRTLNVARKAMTGFTYDARAGEKRDAYLARILVEELKMATLGSFVPVVTTEVYASFKQTAQKVQNKTNTFGQSTQVVKISVNGTYNFMTPLLGILANNIDAFKLETSVFIQNEYF